MSLVLAGYDFTIYSQLSNTMTALFFPQNNPTAATLAFWTIYAVGYLARPLGAIVFGHVGESQNLSSKSIILSLKAAIASTSSLSQPQPRVLLVAICPGALPLGMP